MAIDLSAGEQHQTPPREIPPGEVLSSLATDATLGLTSEEAARRLQAHGPNEPAPIPVPSWPKVLARQFSSKLMWILALATLASLALQEWLNAGAIGVTVLISSAFGFMNEWRSERAIHALAKLTARRAEVIRDGQHIEIAAREVVPGDISVVRDGDVIAADGRVIESRGLIVNESILTGEPEAVAKSVDLEERESATLSTRVFAGTTVVGGSGSFAVTATGAQTELGTIFGTVQAGSRESTPLEARLEILGNRLLVVFAIACGVLIIMGIAQGRDPKAVVELAVSLAIGAVPEGLPAVATAALAIAVGRLAKRDVLVRQLSAVETLGSTTFIVTDKTGTLTENRMVVRSVLLPSGKEVPVTVEEEAPGTLRTVIAGDPSLPAQILMTAALSSDARVEYDPEKGWNTFGDPSETAIIRAAIGVGDEWSELVASAPRIATQPFSTSTRMMTTTHAGATGEFTAAKGAFEQIAKWTGEELPQLHAEVAALGEAGFRVLAVAREAEGQRNVLGALVLEDPIRAEAADAVAACRAAGITLMLVSGDQIGTASTIARSAGILDDGHRISLGNDLDFEDLNGVTVVARASHHQKEAIVTALQSRGAIVAMTGDGVNDAAALRASHVGVAVGPAATDVAIEAADIYLTRGSLLSLAEGITEGRQVAKSLREAIIYLLSASFAMIVLIGAGLLVSEIVPLRPLQVLWMNLVVHIFPALALATSRDPVPVSTTPTTALFSRGAWTEVAVRASVAGLTGVAIVAVAEAAEWPDSRIQALVYLAVAAALIGQCFLIGVRSPLAQGPRLRRTELWSAAGLSVVLLLGGAYLPGLNGALELESPGAGDIGIAAGVVLVSLNVSQILVRFLVRDGDADSTESL